MCAASLLGWFSLRYFNMQVWITSSWRSKPQKIFACTSCVAAMWWYYYSLNIRTFSALQGEGCNLSGQKCSVCLLKSKPCIWQRGTKNCSFVEHSVFYCLFLVCINPDGCSPLWCFCPCQVLVNDFFLVACLEDFIENARLFIFETFCRIHQCISIKYVRVFYAVSLFLKL